MVYIVSVAPWICRSIVQLRQTCCIHSSSRPNLRTIVTRSQKRNPAFQPNMLIGYDICHSKCSAIVNLFFWFIYSDLVTGGWEKQRAVSVTSSNDYHLWRIFVSQFEIHLKRIVKWHNLNHQVHINEVERRH